MMGESKEPLRYTPAGDSSGANSIQAAKMVLLDEYERTGDFDLAAVVKAHPSHASELVDYALWLRGTQPLKDDQAKSWQDDGNVAREELSKACDSLISSAPKPRRLRSTHWSNSSVLALAGDSDPVEAVTERAREIVIQAMDAGWTGPPFDPTALAKMLGVRIIGRNDIRDARIVPEGPDAFQIEFNPNRPPARVRYSLAHEIAHTLFPDCAQAVRNRAAPHEIRGDEWQLEALCNIAAAEFLMPVGSLKHPNGSELAIDRLIERRKEYQVSVEALVIRSARLAEVSCAGFCATRIEEGRYAGRYRVDYNIPSETWPSEVPKGILLPKDTGLAECTGIGYTAKFTENWTEALGPLYIECVGIAPYPGAKAPRVAGMMRSEQAKEREPCLKFVVGDATEGRGDGRKIIAHVVNDATPRWGAGFGLAVRKRWKQVQDDFIAWVEGDRSRLRLGQVHEFRIEETCSIIHMVAQRGYGPSATPRVRYTALKGCLDQLAIRARQENATVHMPRIGSGQGGGSWAIIEELISASLCAAGIKVYIYDLPGQKISPHPQLGMDL